MSITTAAIEITTTVSETAEGDSNATKSSKKIGPTDRLTPRKCSRRMNSCARCGQPVEVGMIIEPWIDGPRFAVAGRYNWVHTTCRPKVSAADNAPAAKIEPPKCDSEHRHEAFPEVLILAKARKNIMLPGPAGCGKTHLAEQVAKALGLRFGVVSCSAGMSEGQLTGKLLPVGDGGKFEFVTTEFIECYEQGGVFLIDEMDAADSNVLLVVNSALANGYLTLPNRVGNTRANRHPDFVCIAATNTYGRGSDRMYVGRAQLDEATLDRFRIGTVPMDYDAKIEKRLCPDAALRVLLQSYREKARAARLQRIVSTRFMRDAYDMLCLGWDFARVEKALFGGWSEDEIRKVKN